MRKAYIGREKQTVANALRVAAAAWEAEAVEAMELALRYPASSVIATNAANALRHEAAVARRIADSIDTGNVLAVEGK